MSGAGLFFILALIVMAVPIGMLIIMGCMNKFSGCAKFEPVLEFVTRPITKLSAKRHDSYIELLNETNMVVGPRPSAETYYDSKAKIKFENSEIYSNPEI